MKLIEEIYIDRFRSFRKETISNISEFAIFAGQNNSGKSNALRALSLFFVDEVEPGVALNLNRDCNAGKSEKKTISIAVKFCISEKVNIQKTLKDLLKKIPKDCWIKKEFEIDKFNPKGYRVNYFVNDKQFEDDEKNYVDQFLNLFNFRYVTANRTPTSVLEENLVELRSELSFKFKSSIKFQSKERRDELSRQQKEALSIVRDIAHKIFEPVRDQIVRADKNIADVNIATPDDITELIDTAVYQLTTGSGQILSEKLQGHGIQNILLFAVLYLIDKNFHRKFGWKIATIWAVEEPETFLHFDLENQLAFYFASISNSEEDRFQMFCTSHSNVFPQYATSHHMFTMQASEIKGRIFFWSRVQYTQIHDFLNKLSEANISNRLASLTAYPHKKIVLVAGLTDEYLFSRLIESHKINNVLVFSIKKFVWDESKKGDSQLINFLKENLKSLLQRRQDCGVYSFFDWDCQESKINSLSKSIKFPNVVYQFNVKNANPLLDKSFRGIERFYPTSIIEKVIHNSLGLITDRGSGLRRDRFYCDSQRYGLVKETLFKAIKEEKKISLKYFKDFITVLTS